jgi:putative ABC transport system permease protein
MELRVVLRSLGTRPGLSATAVGVFAVAIGANAALFGVVRAVLFESPARDPGRLLVLWEQDLEHGRELIEVSYSNFEDWRRESRTFADMAAFGSVNWAHVLVLEGEAHRLSSAEVSSSFFETLGARPHLGRTFRPGDDEIGSDRVAVLSYRLWEDRFEKDAGIVGRAIGLEGDAGEPVPFLVIGVMPEGFEFPRGALLWTPVRPQIAAAVARYPDSKLDEVLRGLNVLFVVGRLEEGISREEAEAELDVILERIADEHGWPSRTIVSTPFLDFHLGGSTRVALRILWGAVGLVLLVACANVAGLLLSRNAGKGRALEIRLALGAGRARLLRGAALESLVLAAAGGALGIALAHAALRLVVATAPPDVPGLANAGLSAEVLAATLALCLLSGLASALVPAWRASSARPEASHARVHGGFVAAQVALAVSVLVGAGLALGSLRNLYEVELGYDAENVLTFQVPYLGSRYPTVARKHELVGRVLERVEALDGVVSAAAVYQRPLEHGAVGMDGSFIAEGQPLEPETAQQNPMLNWQAATPGYFQTMSIRLVDGRLFEETDLGDALPVAIVGERLARHLWPEESAVGKRIWETSEGRDDFGAPRWRTVVGVVEDARYRELTGTRFDFYVPYQQSQTPVGHVALRTEGDPLALVPAVREAMRRIDPVQPIDGVAALSTLVERAIRPWRFTAVILGAFAAVAVALALSGVFGILAHGVSSRGREIGVRMALGATARQVSELFLRRGLALAVHGALAGLVLALGLTRLIAGFLYGIESTDPSTYAGAAVLVVGACLLASWVPARRAAEVDPNEALRSL